MEIAFLLLLFVVAALYSSVGHGGASGYLALMALFGVAAPLMKTSALILNIFVAGLAFVQYYRAGYFRSKLFIPLAATSVPAAFVGGMMQISATGYKIILAICLMLAIGRLLYRPQQHDTATRQASWVWLGFTGLLLGFISGMVGIGGGIILSPLLLFARWANMRETAAVSALFIVVNSLSGLMGVFTNGIHWHNDIVLWVAIAIAGGWIGAFAGSKKMNFKFLRYTLAIVLAVASVKLLFV